MKDHRSQKIKLELHSIRPVTTNFPVHRVNNKRIHSDSLIKAKKVAKSMYTYFMLFLKTSSIHGLKYLTTKKRTISER
jgi:hypothetical protein